MVAECNWAENENVCLSSGLAEAAVVVSSNPEWIREEKRLANTILRSIGQNISRGRADGTPQILNRKGDMWTWPACKLLLSWMSSLELNYLNKRETRKTFLQTVVSSLAAVLHLKAGKVLLHLEYHIITKRGQVYFWCRQVRNTCSCATSAGKSLSWQQKEKHTSNKRTQHMWKPALHMPGGSTHSR